VIRGTANGDTGQHVEAWRLAGDDDFEVRLSCRSLADPDDMVAQLREAGGKTSTTLVLHRMLLDGR
jgi:hypothetical protein